MARGLEASRPARITGITKFCCILRWSCGQGEKEIVRSARRFIACATVVCAALAGMGTAKAESGSPEPAGEPGVRIEARFVDPSSGLEAEWGATGQILLPPAPGDTAFAPWGGARALASSPSRQSVSVAPGDRAAIRVGRQIPFAGWFQRLGRASGLIDGGVEWREVESLLEIEVQGPAPDGSVRLVLTPELAFLQGRSRRVAAFAELRADRRLRLGDTLKKSIDGARSLIGLHADIPYAEAVFPGTLIQPELYIAGQWLPEDTHNCGRSLPGLWHRRSSSRRRREKAEHQTAAAEGPAPSQ